MATILSPSDFANGRYVIPVNPEQETDLQLYIDRVEAKYLPEMFGVELYDLFIADLALPVAGEPTAPRFVKIFNPFVEQYDNCVVNTVVESEGIKEMLKAFVYYLYIMDQDTRVTTVGLKRTISENSENVSGIQQDGNSRWNEGVATYRAIQFYMAIIETADYEEYKGVKLNYNHPY